MDDLERPFARPLYGGAVTHLPSGLVPPRIPLIGRHIALEPLEPARHAAELYAASHDSADALRIFDFLPYGPWPDETAFAAYLRQQAAVFDKVWYALRPTGGDHPVCGMASFMDIHPEDGVIEIGGIWFSPFLQRTRAATEALFLLLEHAMDGLGYRRMQWRCNALNTKSRAAAKRLGFRFEGVFYNHLIFKGRNRDTAWYTILDDEWPEVRSIIMAWLDDAIRRGKTGPAVARADDAGAETQPARGFGRTTNGTIGFELGTPVMRGAPGGARSRSRQGARRRTAPTSWAPER